MEIVKGEFVCTLESGHEIKLKLKEALFPSVEKKEPALN